MTCGQMSIGCVDDATAAGGLSVSCKAVCVVSQGESG
jgi:hypothetical protein